MKKKILIADDDKNILTALTMMLEDEYEVTSISNGHTIQEIEKYLPDLILLDIWMGEIDGRDICKQLKNKSLTKHIPIIMISAGSNVENSTYDVCADAFIAKPFEMDNLLAMVEKYLSDYKEVKIEGKIR